MVETDTSVWVFDNELNTKPPRISTAKNKIKSKVNATSFYDELYKSSTIMQVQGILDDDVYPDNNEKHFTSSDEDETQNLCLKINPYYNLLVRLEKQAQESEETIRQRNVHETIVKHLEGVSHEFCRIIKEIEPETKKDKEFVNPLDPEELQNMFRCGNPEELNLCGRLDVAIQEEIVRQQNQFIEYS